MRVIILTKDGDRKLFSSIKKMCAEYPALDVRSLGEYLRHGKSFTRDGYVVERLIVN